MNRPGIGPQSLRGLPNGFPSQQQQIPQNRSVSTRLPPSSKIATNQGTWAFGGGVPMGSAGLGNTRPGNVPLSSFAQTIQGSSQPATPLDLSEFPSLSGNQPQPSQSAWAASGSRTLGPSSSMRLQQPSTLSSQQQLSNQQQTQQQQDDLFSSSSQLPSSQSAFRFGQNPVGQSSQSNSVDDFPPLNRNANGEIGQDRNSSLIQNVGFGGRSNGIGFGLANPPQPQRNNGLLNALSGSRQTSGNRVASPSSISAASNSRSPIEQTRQGGALDTDVSGFPNSQFGTSLPKPQGEDNASHPNMSRMNGQGGSAIPRSQTLDSNVSASQGSTEEAGPEITDPMAGLAEIDRWGLKGFTLMMNNYPDYAALVTGSDINALGLDLASPQLISTQIYSLWDNEPPRPAVPRYNLPECYTVGNIAPLDTKLTNLNDEALIFMFYSNPGDLSQIQSAQELHNRNWRYHKKLQVWLTKDDMMVPQQIGNGTERGYYIFFDIKAWQRERREFTLVYDDLETIPNVPNSRAM